jgi:ABC-type multidrug transport system fused ATPase/permease subunit
MNTSTPHETSWMLLVRLWRHVDRKHQLQFFAVFGLMLLCALAEIMSLGAVIPFLGILASPETFTAQPWVSEALHSFNITSPETLKLPLTIAFVAAAMTAATLRILLLWVSTRVSFASGSKLSIALYQRTLYQPYPVHVARNTSVTLSGIGKVGSAINILMEFVVLVSSTVMMLAIVTALFLIDPMVAAISMASVGSCYIVITRLARRRLHRNSAYIAEEQTRVFKVVQEGLGGIRDVLLDGSQRVYCDAYQTADQKLRRGQGDNLFIAGSPRFAMEALGMSLIAVLAYLLSLQPGNITAHIPVLGALALGAQRLLPTLQQGYSAWANIIGSRASLADTLTLLDQPMPDEPQENIHPLTFQKTIGFENVTFSYPGSDIPVLQEITLSIPKGARVGITGATGSGKSTAMDILMGLLTPTGGHLSVDNQSITPTNVKAWQRNIAHVPQHIYLADASMAENIAFGVPYAQIDMLRVKWAAEKAQIADFIERHPDSYAAQVGERGIRISGGQRQRLGIARALYKQATVLVFDEATSALDTLTEQSLMEAIESLDRDLTVLIIAHRLTTVRHCDSIIELKQGKMVAQGTFDELIKTSTSFRKMANV